MSSRIVIAIAVVLAAALVYFAWNQSAMRNQKPQQAQEEPAPMQAPEGMGSMPMEAPDEDPGLAWTTPAGWQTRGPEGVRLATYTVAGQGGGEAAECAVYYFGPGQGGGVDANLQRWIAEFENPGRHDVSTLDAGGIAVSRVDVRGAYMAHAMGASGSGGKRPDWGLIGAIAEGPNGDLFFKFTGPAAVVDAASKDFDAMLRSIRKR